MSSYFLGSDVGTGGLKTVLIDEDANLVASSMKEYPLFSPKPLWSEQNPEDWFNAFVEGVKEIFAKSNVDPKEVSALGLAGQMHGLTAVDADGKPLRHAILWNDQRTAAECASITERIGAERLLETTGNPVLPGFTLPKIEWLRVHEPDVFRRAETFLLPKDYLRFRLTGARHSDVSDSSGTALFNVGARRWATELAEELGVPISALPEVFESPTLSSKLTAEAARATGLPEGLPVAAGAGDQAAQAFGNGVVKPGAAVVTVGTSGVVFAALERYRYEPEGRLHAFCHCSPGLWHLMGVMLAAGGSLQWFRNEFCREEIAEAGEKGVDPYEVMTAKAAEIDPGADGLLFLPYLDGERTPYPNPNARGVFLGATSRHTKAHFIRAVIEGVSFGLLDSMELIREAGLDAPTARVSGGGSKSPLWRQIIADMFDVETVVVNAPEGAAFGAALIAALGAGAYRDADDVASRAVRVADPISPSANAGFYADLHQRYRALYRALEEEFDLLAETLERRDRASR